jgi:hypothetical protein
MTGEQVARALSRVKPADAAQAQKELAEPTEPDSLTAGATAIQSEDGMRSS